jgi:hypothetical protein
VNKDVTGNERKFTGLPAVTPFLDGLIGGHESFVAFALQGRGNRELPVGPDLGGDPFARFHFDVNGDLEKAVALRVP